MAVDDFAALLQRAGFSRLRHWTDERGWFAVFLGFAAP
jgi:L-histidine N-alpha-methyltransferase